MDRIVDVAIGGALVVSLAVRLDGADYRQGENRFVAKAQAELAAAGYVLDNEATFRVRAAVSNGSASRFG